MVRAFSRDTQPRGKRIRRPSLADGSSSQSSSSYRLAQRGVDQHGEPVIEYGTRDDAGRLRHLLYLDFCTSTTKCS